MFLLLLKYPNFILYTSSRHLKHLCHHSCTPWLSESYVLLATLIFFLCFILIQTKCDFHNSLKLKGWCHQPGIQSVLVSGYENYFCFSWSLRILTVESVYLILKVVSDGYLVAAYNSNKPEASWKIECATYERYKWGM